MDEVKTMVSNILKDMLGEVKGAKEYLDLAMGATSIDHKKKFIEMANQELTHYDNLCEMMKEKMRMHPNDIMIDNNIVAKTLYEDMKSWKHHVAEHVHTMMEELGIKV